MWVLGHTLPFRSNCGNTYYVNKMNRVGVFRVFIPGEWSCRRWCSASVCRNRPYVNSLSADTGFGTAGGFGTSAFGTTTNTGGLFGSTQNKPGLSDFLSHSLLLGKSSRCLYCFFVCSVSQSCTCELFPSGQTAAEMPANALNASAVMF